MDQNLLDIKNLSTSFLIDGSEVRVLRDVSFSVRRGESIAIVGESGSGKSVTAKSVMRLIPSPPGKVLNGEVFFEGKDLLKVTPAAMRAIRGNRIGMIFQEPMTSLNPVYTSGNQIEESLTLHQHLNKKEAREKAIEMLRMVGIQEPEMRVRAYPHELSGGMRQRVMIAIALACKPDLLIADEPTTALDPTIQAQILDLIKSLQHQQGMAVMYITHDLGIVAGHCETVVVMYAGSVMEKADVRSLFHKPQHPYTQGLLQAMPMIHKRAKRLYTIEGIVPSFAHMPSGCPFAPRCFKRCQRCEQELPQLQDLGGGHFVRCFNPGERQEG